MQESWFLNFQVDRWKCDMFCFVFYFILFFCWDIKWSSEGVIEDLNLFMLLRALASGDAKKKKYTFLSLNTTLSILPTHFITHSTFQFLF